MKVSELKPLEKNPFKSVGDEQIKKIAKSIQEFERMMEIRRIVIDEDNNILGGNKRYFALKKLGYKEIPDAWIEKVEGLSEEQKKEFIVKDNAHWGSEWDYELLGEWNVDLEAWGVDKNIVKNKEDEIEGEIKFSNELDRESNYVVLKFSKDIDWLWVQTILGLDNTYSKRANGKEWAKGVGRVVDGIEAIEKIKKL